MTEPNTQRPDPRLLLTPQVAVPWPVPAEFYPHAISVLKPRRYKDRDGNWRTDWTQPTRTPARGWVQVSTVAEVRVEREALVSEYLLVCPADTPIDGYSKVEWDGKRFDVIGPPDRTSTPHGWHHTEIRLRYVEG